MARRMWQQLKAEHFPYHHYAEPVGPKMYDAEVLAEMGGEREYRHHDDEDLADDDCHTPHFCNSKCGWVWIVKEDGDE